MHFVALQFSTGVLQPCYTPLAFHFLLQGLPTLFPCLCNNCYKAFQQKALIKQQEALAKRKKVLSMTLNALYYDTKTHLV